MKNNLMVIMILALVALRVDALVVNNRAGDLSRQVNDLDITSLTVTGTMNADDLYFVSGKLLKLTDLDLSQVAIVSGKSRESHYWKKSFAANELPVAALADMGLVTVSLPAGLKVIDKAAFAGCTALRTVTFPESLEAINDYAFAGCASLESVSLPASISHVGVGAFMRCTALTSFAIEPSSPLLELEDAALMDCPSLQSVVLNKGIGVLGERVFAGSGLQVLDLASNHRLRSVGDWAMVKTPVVTAKFAAEFPKVGEGVFLYDRDLSSISLGGAAIAISDYFLAGTSIKDIDLAGLSTMGDYALYNVSQVPTVKLPSTTTWLGTRAMAGMVGMTAISCDAEEVPALGENVWQGLNQPHIPLQVPAASVEDYRNADQWGYFWFDSGWLKGDVNGDGEVNVADINAIVGIILGHPADDSTLRRADVNEDGEINIADINAIVEIILSPSNNIITPLNTEDRLHLDNAVVRAGETITLNLTVDHAEAYSAMQCDIILPQGLTLVATTATAGHQRETSKVDGATTRTVTYSMKKDRFDADAKAVLSFTVQADESLAADSRIVVSNIVLADDQNVGWRADDCSAQVTSSTGIDDLNADAGRLWVEGRTLCIESRQGGIARVSAINGVTCDLTLIAGVTRHEMQAGLYVVVVNNKSYKIMIK